MADIKELSEKAGFGDRNNLSNNELEVLVALRREVISSKIHQASEDTQHNLSGMLQTFYKQLEKSYGFIKEKDKAFSGQQAFEDDMAKIRELIRNRDQDFGKGHSR